VSGLLDGDQSSRSGDPSDAGCRYRSLVRNPQMSGHLLMNVT